MCVPDSRTDVKNNENKLALEMATNAQCASLIKRKQGGSMYIWPAGGSLVMKKIRKKRLNSILSRLV